MPAGFWYWLRKRCVCSITISSAPSTSSSGCSGVLREGEGVAVQVRTTLGADVVRLRQQVIALLDGQLSSEAAEAGGVSVIAEGATDDGVRWTLTAGGDDENYVTMLRTEDSAGVIDNGSMGGPKLWGPDLLKVIPAATQIEGDEGFSCAATPRSSISAWSARTAQKLRWSPTQKSTVCASRSFWLLPRRDFER